MATITRTPTTDYALVWRTPTSTHTLATTDRTSMAAAFLAVEPKRSRPPHAHATPVVECRRCHARTDDAWMVEHGMCPCVRVSTARTAEIDCPSCKRSGEGRIVAFPHGDFAQCPCGRYAVRVGA